MKIAVKKLALVIGVCLILGIGVSAYGQQVDLAFGLGGLIATSASNAGSNYTPQSLGGGVYPAFSGTYLLKRNFGINGEVAWRAGQGNYLDILPFRPIFYDFNGIWKHPLDRRVSVEAMAGIGAANIRFYQDYITCSGFGCTNYTSENHFMGHFGGGVSFYVYHSMFVRPEVHLYLISGNQDFSGPWASRIGASVGYTFGRSDY